MADIYLSIETGSHILECTKFCDKKLMFALCCKYMLPLGNIMLNLLTQYTVILLKQPVASISSYP